MIHCEAKFNRIIRIIHGILNPDLTNLYQTYIYTRALNLTIDKNYSIIIILLPFISVLRQFNYFPRRYNMFCIQYNKSNTYCIYIYMDLNV
jgi:hypothetical protein